MLSLETSQIHVGERQEPLSHDYELSDPFGLELRSKTDRTCTGRSARCNTLSLGDKLSALLGAFLLSTVGEKLSKELGESSRTSDWEMTTNPDLAPLPAKSCDR
jgi:hypothetical protein